MSSAFSNVSVMFDPMKQQHSGRQTNWAPFDDYDGDDDSGSSDSSSSSSR